MSVARGVDVLANVTACNANESPADIDSGDTAA